MAAGRADFLCDQGEDWTRVIKWIDARRNGMGAEAPATMNIKDGEGTLQVTLSADDGTIAFLDEANIMLYMGKDVTQSLPDATYYYDLFVTVRGKRIRLLEGHMRVRERRFLMWGEDWPDG